MVYGAILDKIIQKANFTQLHLMQFITYPNAFTHAVYPKLYCKAWISHCSVTKKHTLVKEC